MAKRPSPSEALQKLRSARPYYSGPFHILRTRMKGHDGVTPLDDRALVLIAATLIEQSLEGAIASRLAVGADTKPLFKGARDEGGVLGTFYQKGRMAYALGVFGEQTWKDLEAILWIRNTFAHSPEDISLDTPEIAALCDFNFIDRLTSDWPAVMGREKPTVPRDKFLEAAYNYCWVLEAEAHFASQARAEGKIHPSRL